ncbi:MAG: ABC transporter permease [Acidobacteria bacterium]|nr:ABC transporter permease [Acidobacteriota bacterium]
MTTLLGDLRFGWRELTRDKGFAVTSLLSLSLGILAATAMYSVIHGVIVTPFPYKDIDNLVSIAVRNPDQRGWRSSYSPAEYVELARRATIFEGVAASTISDILWIRDGEPLRLRGNYISNNGFDVMGVPAMLGRVVTANEEAPETKAVLGYPFWVSRFGANPAILGTVLVLNGKPRTVVGVMPPRFMFRGADVYLPQIYRPAGNEGITNMMLTARRKSGVGNAQAQADLDPIIRDLAAASPGTFPQRWRIELITFKDTYPSSIRETLWILFGAVGLLLLIACANVSNLLLARAAGRQREIAMRAALGASRFRIVRQLLTESLLIGIGGGLLGAIGSYAALQGILAVVPPDVFPAESEISLNRAVLAFAVAVSLLTSLLFGLAPALHASGGALANPLKDSSRGAGGGRRLRWMRGALVTLELSLAIILLSAAGLFLKTLIKIQNAPMAVEVRDKLVMMVPLQEQKRPSPEARAAFVTQMLEHVRAVPGVRSATINAGLHPFGGWDFPVEIPGAAKQDQRPVDCHQVDDAYLAATGIALRAGRFLNAADIGSRRLAAVVNETFARRYFGGESPIGKTVKLWRLKMAPFNIPNDVFEIVGVTQDAIFELHNGDPHPELYIPHSVTGLANVLLIRSQGDPARMAEPVRKAIYAMDGTQFVDETKPLTQLIDEYAYSRGRFSLWLMGAFAVAGLALAVIGVYGLLAHIVERQRREIGVRMALGADFCGVVGMVLRRGARMIGGGLAAGVAVSYLLLRQFGAKLGVADPLDPWTLAGSCIVLALAGLAACLGPALRAARLAPMEALRAD